MLIFCAVKNNWPLNLIKFWGPALLLMLVIFILSARPSYSLPDFGNVDTLIKKGLHFSGYGLLALSYLRGVSGVLNKRQSAWLFFFLAIGLIILYAISDEYHQSFTPGRTPRWTDVGIDTAGGLVAIVFWRIFPSVRKVVSPWMISVHAR